MDEKQTQVIGECLRAAASGRFIPDWEFSTLFGVEREDVAWIADAWPEVNQSDETVWLAINGSMGNLMGYPIDRPKELPTYLSVSRDELQPIFEQWRNETGQPVIMPEPVGSGTLEQWEHLDDVLTRITPPESDAN